MCVLGKAGASFGRREQAAWAWLPALDDDKAPGYD
jgi:hypothetical protein